MQTSLPKFSPLKKCELALRASLFYLVLSLVTILIASTSFLLAPFPYMIRYRYITSWSHAAVWLVKNICGVRYEVHGLENIPKDTPCVVLCKHQSAWETFALQVLLPPQCWVLKKKFLYLPFFGWSLSLLKPIAIPHKLPKSFHYVVAEGAARLKAGLWLVVFPEGTRTAPGEKGQYARSGALIAEQVGYPVLPIAHNAGRFWRRQGFLKYPGTVQVYIGKPIKVKPRQSNAVMQEVENWIEAHVI